jgi:hypothetical protein
MDIALATTFLAGTSVLVLAALTPGARKPPPDQPPSVLVLERQSDLARILERVDLRRRFLAGHPEADVLETVALWLTDLSESFLVYPTEISLKGWTGAELDALATTLAGLPGLASRLEAPDER